MTAATALAKRWPTALGLILGAMSIYAMVNLETADAGFTAGVPVLAIVYIGAFVFNRRSAAWLVLLAAIAAMVTLIALEPGFDPTLALTLPLLAFWVWSIVQGRLFSLQTVGVLVFGALGVAAVLLSPQVGAVLVGLAFLSHGFWDAWHYVRDQVVPRSYAELCFVVDILIGTSLLILL